MSDSVVTHVDRPYGQQPDTRAAAARRIAREEKADLLLAMLGLTETPGPLIIDGRHCCTNCRKPLPDPISNGGRRPCRRVACVAAAAEEAE